MDTQKQHLLHYLQGGREVLIWKLDGLSDYDVRRPLVPTGTNLLGLVKHVAMMEAGYLGDCFGRPYPEQFASFDSGAEPNADMWATPDEPRAEIIDLYRRVWVHSNATIAELALDTLGAVPWWPPERRTVTLHQILVHVLVDTQRHAGHADIIRELIDGAAGILPQVSNLPRVDAAWWIAYCEKLETAARSFL